jgi:signal transduction histidine kinase
LSDQAINSGATVPAPMRDQALNGITTVLRSLLPQSLFGRLLTALLTVVGITLLIIVLLILHERRELELWRTGASGAARSIVEITGSLARLPPEQRRSAIADYAASSLRLQNDARRGPPPQRAEILAMEAAFAKHLRAQLGPQYTIEVVRARRGATNLIRLNNEPPRTVPNGSRSGPPGRTGPMGMRVFDVTVDLPDGERITFRTSAPQPGPPLPRQIFLQLSVLTLVLAGVLYVMTRSITKPLSALALAADQIGRGALVVPLPEQGASELRDATRAFNTMQDRLRRYLDSRTRVLAAMSHDLRTPLTRLRLRAESIDDDALRERFNADLDDMTEMVRGALNMFRDLNDTEATVAVDINELLNTLQQEFAELHASVTISGRADRPLPAKPNALKRCLTNLLRNAVDYGVRAHVDVCDGPQLTIRIRDEGPGIPAESLEQVFEPFYRIESSRNRDTGGTGLGLSIARDIAQAHGGTIQLTNLPERGLEAMLKLPR